MRLSRRTKALGALAAGAVAVLALPLSPADAATFTVTTTTDGGAGSLRDAIAQANASGGADTIEVPAGTYTLTSGQLNITGDLTIVGLGGASATIIDAGGANRIFTGGDIELTIDGLTLQDGNVTPQGGGAMHMIDSTVTIRDSVVRDSHARFGGAIYADASNLTIVDSEFVGNRADDQQGGGYGGAIQIEGGVTLTISGSTFQDNRALFGNAGAIVSTNTTGTITNSTFTENGAVSSGGAFRFDNGTNIALRYVTIEGNELETGTLGAGVAVLGSGSATLTNVLLLGNHGVGGTDQNCGSNNGGAIVSQGGNLSDDATCTTFFTQASDLNDNSGTTVGALADNGGPTRTMALQEGSSALDAAVCIPAVTTVDQRGITRPQGTGCDIGAYELEVTEPTTTTTTEPPGTSSTVSTTPTTSSTVAPATAVTATPAFTG